MRRPKLRIRTLMLVIALFAALLATGIGLWRRSEGLRRTAAMHAYEAQSAADTAWGFNRFGNNTVNANRYWRIYYYHDALRKKYEHAAGRPWLPVAPDHAPPDNSAAEN